MPVHGGRMRQPVAEDDGQLRPAHRLDERAGILPVEGVHGVGATLEAPPHQAGLEVKRVAASNADRLPGSRGRRLAGWQERRHVGPEGHLGREHRQPRRHRDTGPLQACGRAVVRAMTRVLRSGPHATDGELEQVRREESGARRLAPEHHLALGFLHPGVSLRRDEDDELLQVDVAQNRCGRSRPRRAGGPDASRAAPPMPRRSRTSPAPRARAGPRHRARVDSEENRPLSRPP